ncbi:MAG: hypothetical protein PHT99_06175 [Methanoregula sp.]|nr:hypothetical protein [Methanoregula sp.]
MAGLNDDAQWIVLMGFIVSFSLFFLAILINQSAVVGQTTAESVSEFPKNDIRGVRDLVIESALWDDAVENVGPFNNKTTVQNEIKILSLSRLNSVVNISSQKTGSYTYINIHYNNGVTGYNETYTYP